MFNPGLEYLFDNFSVTISNTDLVFFVENNKQVFSLATQRFIININKTYINHEIKLTN